MRFDLTDMRLFLTVIERGSITAGAQAMHLALASASERIAGMEAALGAPLLERNRRGVQATAAGEAFARHARAILGQVEQMRGELRSFATGLKGRIKLLSNTAALATLLPPRLARFLADYPDLSIDLDERPSVDIVQIIAEGRADLGVVSDTTDLGMLQTHLIAQDQLVVVAHRSHRIAGERAVAFAEIVGEAFVGLSDAALEMHLAERASRIGRQINYRIRMRSVDNVGMLAAAGIGLVILSEASARMLERPELAIVPLSEPWATRRLHLCARDFDALTPHARLLAEALKEAAQHA
ncbi:MULTISPECIES: LysR substrate-binding domain-containing protein [unclassified Caballeronia]|uniref:LysR substrate-binding domain-containing protein n=1 Tax=unclassified Caballeronia TaxID=2646786 RepID=UPI0028676F7D|nr:MULTISPECIES: LysR substrate-binding domain-containing protein [unclassified Caballeronia]MDR5816609.1 LysR substrate-binding domain-containing protein [Caballeronia sp. LZ033]MDR5881408.1 LysR substrate-binding domain-containing protein [Caballeronia sp. LZ032]